MNLSVECSCNHLRQSLIDEHLANIFVLGYQPCMGSIPKLDFGDRIGGAEQCKFQRRVGSLRAGEWEFTRR